MGKGEWERYRLFIYYNRFWRSVKMQFQESQMPCEDIVFTTAVCQCYQWDYKAWTLAIAAFTKRVYCIHIFENFYNRWMDNNIYTYLYLEYWIQKQVHIILIEAHWIQCKSMHMPSKSYKSTSVRARTYKLKICLQ